MWSDQCPRFTQGHVVLDFLSFRCCPLEDLVLCGTDVSSCNYCIICEGHLPLITVKTPFQTSHKIPQATCFCLKISEISQCPFTLVHYVVYMATCKNNALNNMTCGAIIGKPGTFRCLQGDKEQICKLICL